MQMSLFAVPSPLLHIKRFGVLGHSLVFLGFYPVFDSGF